MSKEIKEKRSILNYGMFHKQDLRKMIIPLIIEQALMLTVGMFDTIMVSAAGESAVSGVSLVDAINTLLLYLFIALATGGAIVAGQYIGNKNNVKSNSAGKQLISISFCIAMILMMICLIFNNQILSFLYQNVETEVMSNAKIYFYVTVISFPFIAVYSSAAALFRIMGNTKNAMINSFVMNVINIGGNALFIYVMKWGAFGVGLSTTFSRIISAIVIIIMLRNSKSLISVRSYKFWNTDIGMVKTILKIGIPSGLENCVFQIGRIVLTTLIAAFGTTAITANAVTGSLINVATIPGQAVGLAITTVVSQCVGAKEFGQANLYSKYMIKLSWLFMIVLNACILFLLKPILDLYNLSHETYLLAFTIMIIHIIGWVTVWPMSFALPNAFRAAGDVKYPMVISALSMVIFRIGFSYLLAYGFGFGALSVWIAMLMDWTFRCICFFLRWHGEKWKQFAVVK